MKDAIAVTLEEWRQDCIRWHGRELVGMNRHWCDTEWDGLPIDETTWEFMVCGCEWHNPVLQARATQIKDLLWEVFRMREACTSLNVEAWRRQWARATDE